MCDGVPDCPQSQDEKDCNDSRCPGNYMDHAWYVNRSHINTICCHICMYELMKCFDLGLLLCKQDSICVAPHEICDGTVHCRLFQDDELLCDTVESDGCADGCVCVGTIVYCKTPKIHDLKHLSPQLKILILRNTVFGGLHFSLARFRDIYIFEIHDSDVSKSTLSHNMFFNTISAYKLVITTTKIKYLVTNAFPRMPRLKVIHVENSRIVGIHRHAFHNLSNLNNITLFNCGIVYVSSYSFCTAYEVQHLNISNNELKHLRRHTFACLDTILTIDLTVNYLTFIELGNNQVKLISIHVSDVYLCCHIPSSIECIHLKSSVPRLITNGILCKTILSNKLYSKLIILLISIVILAGNSQSVLSLYLNKSSTKDYELILNIALGELILGLFLVGTLINDWLYSDRPVILHRKLANQLVCKVLSSFPMLSVLVTRTEICFLTIRQLLNTRYRFKLLKLGVIFSGGGSCSHLIIWLAAIACSAVISYEYHTLDQSCFLSHGLLQHDTLFWISMSVFVFYPAALFILICLLYISIIRYSISTKHQAGQSTPYTLIYKVMRLIAFNFVVLCASSLSTFVPTIISHPASDAAHAYQDLLLVILVTISPVCSPHVYSSR